MTPNTDSPDADAHDVADAPDASDDDADYPKFILLSLRNFNRKISPNKQQNN